MKTRPDPKNEVNIPPDLQLCNLWTKQIKLSYQKSYDIFWRVWHEFEKLKDDDWKSGFTVEFESFFIVMWRLHDKKN